MSTSLTVARRRLAEQIGHFGVFTAVGGSTTTLLCNVAFQSTELPTSALAHAWIFVPSFVNPNQRRVQDDGLDGSTFTITVDGNLASPVANGTVFEVHTRLPATRSADAVNDSATVMGLQQCLNAALRHLLVKRIFTLGLVDGQRDYSLASWPAIDRAARLVDVLEPNARGTSTRSATRPWELRERADGSYLHFDAPYRFGSGSPSVDLEVLVPGDTFIKVGGATWSQTAFGLQNEADEAGPDPVALVEVAKAFAYQAIAATMNGANKAMYLDLYQKQVQRARRVHNYDRDNDIDPSVPDEPEVA